MSKKPAAPAVKTADEPKPPLPKSLLQALPGAEPLLRDIIVLEKKILALRGDMEQARKGGAIPLARAFVVLHRLVSRLNEALRPLVHDTEGMFADYRTRLVPEAFEAEGITSLPLAEGYRIGVSNPFRASIKGKDAGGDKDKAYQWLRENGLGDLIQPTVNASSLSAAFKELAEDKNIEPPETLFNAARIPNTSVTKV